MIVPAAQGTSPFWEPLLTVYRCVSESLGMELTEEYVPTNDRMVMLGRTQAIFKAKVPPHYLLISSHSDIARNIISLAKASSLRKLMFMTNLVPEDLATLSSEMEDSGVAKVVDIPSADVTKGHALANALLAEARRRHFADEHGRIQVLAISGGKSWLSSTLREKGLRQVIEGSSDAELPQVVYAKWQRSEASFMARSLLLRHPKAKVIWVASDDMAAGVIDAARQLGLRPGVDILVGGIDVTPNGLELVQQGDLAFTVGEHWTSAAMRVVYLYDDFHGKKPAPPLDGVSPNLPVVTVGEGNVGEFIEADRTQAWSRIDWRRLSLTDQPARTRYTLDYRQILAMVREPSGRKRPEGGGAR